MGGVASSLTRPYKLSGKEFKEHPTTKEVNKMANALFQFMYNKSQVKDIFEIADNPGEYVIAISDLITAQFDVIGYTTSKNKFGEIYFKKWKDLDPPKSEDEYRAISQGANTTRKAGLNKLREKSEVSRKSSDQLIHTRNAKIIAFYFVRIFQILGSLLLVVKDTKFPDTNSELVGKAKSAADRAYAGQAFSVIKGFNPPRQVRSVQGGGGVNKFPAGKPLGPFEFLRKYLLQYDQEYVKEFKDNYGVVIPSPAEGYYKFDYSNNLFFKVTLPDPLPDTIGAKLKGSEQELCILVKDRNGTISNKSIKVTVVYFTTPSGPFLNEYKAPSEFEKSKQMDRYPSQVVISTRANNSDYYADFRPRDYRKIQDTYVNGMNYILHPSGKPNDLYESLNNEYDPATQFVEILEVYTIKSILRDKSSGMGYSRFIPEKKKENNNSKVSTALSGPETHKGLMVTFNELNKMEHKPHCIARALDLLDKASINDDEREKNYGQTRICSSSMKGKGSSYQPLKAIGQLFGKLRVKSLLVDGKEFENAEKILRAFVGKDSQSTPLTVDELNGIDQKDEANEMSAAIQRLVDAFNMNNKLVSEIKSFDDINLDPPTICSRSDIEKNNITKGRPEYIEIQKYTQQLLAFHLNNIIGITEFLRTIFNMKQRPDGSWDVKGPDTELLFAGYDTLDEITRQARELLVNYYSGCESIYQKGVKTWVESLPATPEVGQRVLAKQSAPPASAPPGAS